MREKIFNWLEDYWVYLIFVFWISGLSIILIAFQGMGWFYLAALSLLFYWTPYGCSICHKSHYVSADNCDMSNPLYVRGFFRKNSNKKRILSVYCKIKLPKVAKRNWRILHLQIGEKCKALPKALRNGAAPEW